ncbi:hypothetical protein [Streptomyces bacillaris]|uniref:hypothetical protein n=1 Tax=Streptomyces bacillaris TaxID=68179 RepID=UPI00381768E4
MSASEAKAVIQSVLSESNEDKFTRAVLNALAVAGTGAHHKTLTARREEMATAYQRHSDTIEEWENRGFMELAHRLLSKPAKISHLYDVLNVERIARFRRDVREEVTTLRFIRSQVNNLSDITIHAIIDPENESGSVQFDGVYGCEVVAVHESPRSQRRQVALKLHRTLSIGEEFQYIVRARYTSGKAATPKEIIAPSPKSPVKKASFKMQFDADFLPSSAWSVDGCTPIADVHDAARFQHIDIHESGLIEVTHASLTSGFRYGIAWEWPSV